MLRFDRTVKILLGVTAALLAVLIFRPQLPIATQALAQGQVDPGDVTVGFRIPQPSLIAVPDGQYVREIQVMDNTHCFIVRYDNRIEVYRVQDITSAQLARMRGGR